MDYHCQAQVLKKRDLEQVNMQPIAKQKCYCPCVMRKVVHSHEPIIHNSPCIQIMALVVVLELLNTITSPSPKPCCLRVAFSLKLVELIVSLSQHRFSCILCSSPRQGSGRVVRFFSIPLSFSLSWVISTFSLSCNGLVAEWRKLKVCGESFPFLRKKRLALKSHSYLGLQNSSWLVNF